MDCRHEVNVLNLPLEVLEIILSKLISFPRSLVSASNACTLWRHLATRICQQYCLRNIEERLMAELIDELHFVPVTHQKLDFFKENGNELWINVYWKFHETFLDKKKEKQFLPVQIPSVTHILNEGPYLVISSYVKEENKSEILVLNSTKFSISPKFCDEILGHLEKIPKFTVHGTVQKTCLLFVPVPVLLVLHYLDIQPILLPLGTNSLEPEFKFLDMNMHVKADPIRTCCENYYFITQEPGNLDNSFGLYQASLPSGCHQLNVVLLCHICTQTSVYFISLSGAYLNTMETSGYVRTYQVQVLDQLSKAQTDDMINSSPNLEGVVLVAESEMKKDLRYPNPTILTKDTIFSSTIVSRDLLGYWHMDRGRDYWLIGSLYPAINSKRRQQNGAQVLDEILLHQTHIGFKTGLDVTAIHYRRGVLFCGTKEGHLLVYKMGRVCEEELEILKDFPLLNVPNAAQMPIFRLGSLFTPFGLIVVAGDENCCRFIYFPIEKLS